VYIHPTTEADKAAGPGDACVKSRPSCQSATRLGGLRRVANRQLGPVTENTPELRKAAHEVAIAHSTHGVRRKCCGSQAPCSHVPTWALQRRVQILRTSRLGTRGCAQLSWRNAEPDRRIAVLWRQGRCSASWARASSCSRVRPEHLTNCRVVANAAQHCDAALARAPTPAYSGRMPEAAAPFGADAPAPLLAEAAVPPDACLPGPLLAEAARCRWQRRHAAADRGGRAA